MKTCSKCGESKLLELFANRKVGPKHRDGKDHWCKECHRKRFKAWYYSEGGRAKSIAAQKKWQASNKEKFALSQRRRDLRTKYGLTLEAYDFLLALQDGTCAICGLPPISGSRHTATLMVDHDHESGQVRGLVHSNCNLMLGYAKDNPELLRKAAIYVERGGIRELQNSVVRFALENGD